MNEKEHLKFQTYWTWSSAIIRPFLKWIYKYSYKDAPEIAGNYLVLCNHNSNLDPWLCALSFKRQMYFLAGENIFRLGFVSYIIKKLWAPISKIKGKSDTTAVINLMRHLKEGHNTCLFPEGNRSFTGVTGTIFPATAKLVKNSGAALVTFRICGMYFTSPRWATFIRRGKTWGSVVNVYTPEQLKIMSLQEIHAAIESDLYEDAYKTQETQMIQYRSRFPARGIESALYICPQCNKIGTITTKGKHIMCSHCKTEAIFTQYGYIEGGFKYKTVRDWTFAQPQLVAKHIKIAGTDCVATSENTKLLHVDFNHVETCVAEGLLQAYSDKFIIGDKTILFSDILEMSIVFRKTLLFSTKDNKNFQLQGKTLLSALLYLDIFTYYKKLVKDEIV